MNVLLARQPIYDAARGVHGYELLFRSPEGNSATFGDGTAATAQVLLNAVVGVGLDRLSADDLFFINCTREVLMLEPFIPPERCVLEILESTIIDDEVLDRIHVLRRRGYRIALDDFSIRGNLTTALPLADYLKLDVLELDDAELRRHVALRRPGLTLIAEKVENEKQMEYCRSLGFDLYQGYFLRRPEVIKGDHIPTGKLAALRLISACQDPDASVQEVSTTVAADVSMTYSLLRLANSALFGRSRPVKTVESVVMWMGTEYLTRWATLLALASGRGCPVSYLGTALQRGFMCESLAAARGGEVQGSSFLVGLLSTLDSILDIPMEQILAHVQLSAELRAALEMRRGKLGELLNCTLAYENGDIVALDNCGVDDDMLKDAYWRAIEHAESTLKELALLQS